MLKIQQWIVFLTLFAVSASCFALPFNIYPVAGISLPTFVQSGQTAPAYYTLTNNANRTLNNNFVKYLPPNVAQVTTDASISNLCGATFNLAPNGTVGDTCTLEFVVSGAVNPNDPDPHHHLFACLYGGVLCAGTNFPLSVVQVGLLTSIIVSPTGPAIAVGQTQQFTAAAVFSDGSMEDVSSLVTWTSSNATVATISSSGLASAMTVGNSTITASFEGVSGSTVLTVDNLAIVSGNYTNNAAASFPILLQSSDNGTTWAYTVSSDTASVLPPTSSAFVINGASCTGTLCVSVGSYSNGASTNIYAFQTQNAGTSYTASLSAVSGTLPSDYASGSLNAVSCSGTICVAAGSYNTSTVQVPLALQTTDSGTSYLLAVDSTTPTLPTDFQSAGTFTNTTCTSSICLASGDYTSTLPNQFPWLAESVPPSGAWTYAVTSTAVTNITIPDYASAGLFNASGCNAFNCIAAGSYTTTSVHSAPLIAQATSSGTGWGYEVVSTNVPSDFSALPGNFNLTGAACATDACIAVGVYTGTAAGDSQDAPVIYQSVAGSGTWAIVVSDTVGPTLPSNTQAELISASCYGTLCVAAGTYTDLLSGVMFPLIMVSNNSGSAGTWTIQSNPTAPPDLISVTIGATSCQNAFCTIAATYNDGANTEPLVIETNNSGITFTYAVIADNPAEPSDAVNVFLTSSAISSLLKPMTHKDFDYAKQLKNRLTHY